MKANLLNPLAEKLLMAVKTRQPTEDLVAELARLPFENLQTELHGDNQKKAFWINIYNAFFQILRQDKGIEKPHIFRDKLFVIGGRKWSLDEVEHGILRKYRWKYSLGYLPNPFLSGEVKKLAVKTIDYRIHFALNCGAKSCPPIAFYSAENIDRQLEMATLSFLESETEVFPEKREIHVTRLFKWFLGDFGGMKGVRRILKEKLGIDPKGHKLIFKAYSWDEQLDNFV